jgi:hypothetical protein
MAQALLERRLRHARAALRPPTGFVGPHPEMAQPGDDLGLVLRQLPLRPDARFVFMNSRPNACSAAYWSCARQRRRRPGTVALPPVAAVPTPELVVQQD